MSRQMSDEELYRLARRRVMVRRGFFVHLGVYIVVNAFLVLVWYMTGHGYPWFLWVLGGWGIGLLLNAVAVFTMGSEEGAVNKEYEKLKQQMRK
jgi:hypothetical protein